MGHDFIDRTGETRIMNNGLSATVIAYRNNKDIDVQFDNGGIVYNNQYCNFVRGMIKCPMLLERIDDYVKVTNPNVTPKFTFFIDSEDVGILGNSLWSKNGDGYASANINSKAQSLHSLIMRVSNGMLIDHKSGDKLDCRKSNMRDCTYGENSRNRLQSGTNNTSGYKGVTWAKKDKKWASRIKYNKKRIHLGLFTDIKDAARAYNEAAIKYHGEFARLNDLSA